MKFANPSEEKFSKFLDSNSIAWEKPPEEYGDFYLKDVDALIEHKSLEKSELTKVLERVNAPYKGPIKYVGAISSKLDIHSYDSIKDKLSDANAKASRANKDPKYKNTIFLCLISLETGWDLKIIDILCILNLAKFINYPFKPNQTGIYDQNTEEYLLVYEPPDGSNLLVNIDYVGIITRKNEDFKKWKVELIQKPKPVKRDMGDITSKFQDFLNIIRPKFVLSMNAKEIKLTESRFPILFPFAKDYTGNNPDDIRLAFRDRPYLLNGEGYWLKYERALQDLSQEDRDYLLGKLQTQTVKLSEEKGWPHFEEVLNEGLAYEYLLRDGYVKVRFVKEESAKGLNPDLKVLKDDDSLDGLAEVKSIRFSDDEYVAVKKELETGDGRFLAMDIHPNLYKKITHNIEEAINQMWSYNSSDLSLRRINLFLNLDSGNLMDVIFTPQSNLEQFLCQAKEALNVGTFSGHEGQKIELKAFVLSGTGEPVELKCKQ